MREGGGGREDSREGENLAELELFDVQNKFCMKWRGGGGGKGPAME